MIIMKHLMRYEGYTSRERVDDILDKISKYGMMSLTSLEKEFLNSFKTGEEEQIHDKIAKEETESIFEDDNGYFKFEHEETEDYGDEMHYIGTLYVPSLELPNGKKIEGRDNLSTPNEISIHSWIYRTRPEVNAVLHAHPATAVLF